MKKLLLLTKTLLVAAGLLVGTNAWGDTGYNATRYYQNYETEASYSQGWTTTNMNPSWENKSGNHYLLLTSAKASSASISFGSNSDFTEATDYRFSFKMNANYHTDNRAIVVTVKGIKNNEEVTLFKVKTNNATGYGGTGHVLKSDDSEITTFSNAGYGNQADMAPTIPVVITSNSTEGTKLIFNGGDAVTLDAGLVSISEISITTNNSSALKVSFDDMKLESDLYYKKTLYSNDYSDEETYKTGWSTTGNGTTSQKEIDGTTYLYFYQSGNNNLIATFTFATAGMDFSSLTDYCYEFDYAHCAANAKRSTFTLTKSDGTTLFSFADKDEDSGYGTTNTVKDGSGNDLGTFTTETYLKGGPFNANTIYHFKITSSASGTKLTIRNPAGIPVVNNVTLDDGLVQLKTLTYVNGKQLTHTIFGNMKLTEHVATVPATIGQYGYATFSNTNNLDFTNVEGLTAYIATARDDVNSTIKMKEVSGVITNTGLVLKGDEGTYYIPVTETSGTTYNTESATKNYLFAISSDYQLGTSGTGTNYVLSVQNINDVPTVVWAPITSNDKKASVKTGQAALWIPTAGTSSARGLRMVFGNEITGIDQIDNGQLTIDNSQPVKRVVKGQLVIEKNGKKFNANGQQVK